MLDAFYEVNRRLADPETRNETLIAIGAKFSSLGLEDMETVVEQTRFYKTPDEALTLFASKKFQETTTPDVVEFCISQGIIDATELPAGANQVGFNDDKALLNFSDKYLQKVLLRSKGE